MGLVRSFIGTDGIWQYIPHINTGLFSIIKVHFLLFANLIVDWHINTINFTDSGNIYLDQDRRLCLVDGENVELTFKEYELLRLFLSNLGIVLTREIIMETVWGTDFAGESRTVDMHIKTLRKKLKEAGSLIITVRNVGYKLE